MFDSRTKKIEGVSIIAIFSVAMILFMAPYTSTYAFATSNTNDNKRDSHGIYIHDDTSYVRGIKINDVDRSSSHIIKVSLTRIDDNKNNIPNHISVVAVGNEDKHIAGSITISTHFTDQKTASIDLLKRNGHNANIDNSNDVTVFVVPSTVSIHH
jgi:hypothetical protein